MRRLVALVLVSPVLVPAAAQGGGDSLPRRLQPVAVTARQSARVTGGAAVIEVSTDSLRVAPATNLDQALRTVPFVGVKTNSRGETELSIRGSDSRTPAVILDGVNLSLGWDSRTDASIIPLTAATGIRVTRGLSSLMLGPNVTGGAVEVGLAEGVDRRRSAVVAGADHTGAASAAAVIGLPVAVGPGRLAVVGGAGWRDRPNVAAPPGVYDGDGNPDRLINSDFRQQDLFGSARYALRQGAFVGATVTAMRGARGVVPELSVGAPRYWRVPTLDRTVAVLSAGSGAFRTPLGVASVDVRAAQNEGDLLIETYRDRSYSQVTARERGAERMRSTRAVAEHSLGGRGELGVSYTTATVEYRETLLPAAPADYEQRLASLAIETDWDLPRGSALTVSYATDRADNPKTGGRTPLGARTAWAGRLGVETSLGGARWHATVSRRARFPALRELYSGALNRFVPNPDLRPETVHSYEAGTLFLWRGVELHATAFHARTDDAIVRLTRPDRRFFRVNQNRITATGVETFARWRFADAEFLADLTVQDPQVRNQVASTLTRPEYQPHLRGSFTGIFPIAAATRLTAAAIGTGSQHCLNAATGGQERLKPFARVDLLADRVFRVGAGLWSQVRALAGVDNALNLLGYDICGVPQPGRTLRVGLELR